MTGLAKRIISGLCLGAAFLLVANYAPSLTICALLCAIVTIALLEFYKLLDAMTIPSFRIMGVAVSILLIAGTWLTLTLKTRILAGEHELIILFIITIAVLIRQFPQKNNDQPLATMACTLFGILYVPFLFNYFTKLAFTWEGSSWIDPIGSTGLLLVFYLIAVVKFTDIGAFVIGSRLGRHKLIPRISPSKTWEGFIGGVAVGLLVSLCVYFMLGGHFGVITMRIYDAISLGILLPVVGTVGDLTESMLKRAAGSKDAGRLIPGMGGALDVLDSLLFGAPTLYIYTKFLLAC
ncbi:MAG: CDP-archaeol synthase [Kiritimatiellae bacterium]|nr:CDP-archaeol synthase [Kiritimatiellia bacterium]